MSEWTISEQNYPAGVERKALGRTETLFSLANGHLGLRGDFEEGGPSWQRGTYVNGFFETEPIVYGEVAYGFARDHQTMLNLPDGRLIGLKVDGEDFLLDTGSCQSWKRSLDMSTGILERRLGWRLPSGRRLELTVRRLVSFVRPEIAAIEWELSLPDGAAEVRIESVLDAGVRNLSAGHDPRVGSKLAHDCLEMHDARITPRADGRGATASVAMLTRNSRLGLACAARTVCPALPGSGRVEGERLSVVFSGRLAAGASLKLTKYLAYSRPYNRDTAATPDLGTLLDAAETLGFAGLAAEQAAFLERFWHSADIRVKGDARIQEALRFNVFQLLQSAGRDGSTNLAAKGLSGEGYEGHYFWDTEVYGLPLFTYADPATARALLSYRHATLGAARERAAELDHPGALYPWRTINGREASAYYEAGTAQYHINADIILAARRYALASGDRAFLTGPLARMSVETARLFLDLGDFVERSDGTTAGELESRRGTDVPLAKGPRTVFCINTVTGPDEYTALVNNNVYTNLMAAMNLAWAADLLDWLSREEPAAHAALVAELGIKADEAVAWNRAANLMFVPYDPVRRLFPQDDAFFNKAPWYVDREPVARRPLLLHYHPLVIYRYQVLKQPDLVLAQFLRGDLFNADEKKRHFDYYEALTTGDSSLSHCIQSIVAAEVGDGEKAWSYLTKTVRMDLDDLHGNVHDGIHAAAMAGSWLSMVYGFGGLREHYGRGTGALPQSLGWSFAPVLPRELSGLAFRMHLGQALLEVDIARDSGKELVTVYRLLAGEAVEISHRGAPVRLDAKTAERRFVEALHV